MIQSTINQVFTVLPKTLIAQLYQKYVLYEWAVIDETKSAIRLIASWATDKSKIDEFIEDLKINRGK